MRQRTGGLADFGDELKAGSPFGLIVAEVFDQGMDPQDWFSLTRPGTDPRLVAEVERMWTTYVLPRFAAQYGLNC